MMATKDKPQITYPEDAIDRLIDVMFRELELDGDQGSKLLFDSTLSVITMIVTERNDTKSEALFDFLCAVRALEMDGLRSISRYFDDE